VELHLVDGRGRNWSRFRLRASIPHLLARTSRDAIR
jgi:hypothetical protein